MLTAWAPRQFRNRSGSTDIATISAAVPIRLRNPDVPPRVAAVIDEALIDTPHIRIGSAGDLALALREATYAKRADH